MCFVDFEICEDVSDKIVMGSRSSGFDAAALFGKKIRSPSAATSTNSMYANQQPMTQESAADYAKRILASGEYNSLLCEIFEHPILENLFMNKLMNHDQQLYRVGIILVVHCSIFRIITMCLRHM